ncbi:hypothetical protein [Streptomyces spinosisporus]|uniref:Uncharacterized protein n=1 Tax=Streptomyces spinosisporus TaxID=2927582 RepID=A0ABS9XDY3_9ACTN|nr:hypothetical protein [Streptomyces spinosisporus]MCI3240300.1 hypothetical protein [Streptomyces spinosisporus]
MAFPQEPLGLRGRLRLGSDLQDITADLYTRDAITHKRGRAYRANAADPASCSATIKNRDGRYSERNPEGPYYGLIGRNTPFQFDLPGGPDVYLALKGGTDRATTPDAAALDITGSIDIRFEIQIDNLPQANGVILGGKWLVTGSQRSWLMLIGAQGELILRYSPDGTSQPQFGSTEAISDTALRGRIAVRSTRDASNGQITHYTAPSIDGPWTQLGLASAAGAGSTIFSSASPLAVGDIDTVTAFVRPEGKIFAFQLRNGIDGTVVADVDFTAQTVGASSFTDDTGLTWTLAGDAELSDRVTRFAGEIPEWPPKWSPSEADAWTPIEAAGILRRMGQGQKSLASTLRRKIPTVSNLLAYWPMEEGKDASQASSPIAGVGPLKLAPANWANVDTLASSSPLPTIDSSGSAACLLSGSVPRPASTPLSSWLVQYMYRLDTVNTTVRTFLRIRSTGTISDWYIQMGSGISRIIGRDSDGNAVFTGETGIGTDLWGQWIAVQFQVSQSGSSVNWQIVWTDVGGDAGAGSGSFSGTIGYPTGVASPPDGYASDIDGLALGHISVWSVWDSVTVSAYAGAVDAWAGETAGERMQRLCAEENVPLTIVGDPSDTELVGPQRPKALLDLLRECADADGGIFGELRERRELVYRTRLSLYNQDPKLTLDYAQKQMAPPFEPVEDDQIRNDWTVTRDGGSSGYATLTEGRLSVQDPPDGIGLYDDSTTLNLFSDDQTSDAAGWQLHLTSWDEARYPSVTLQLHRHPAFIPAVLSLDVGDKIRIENLPKKFAGGGAVELLIDGWTETMLPRKWEITFNCSPAGPYTVAIADDEVLGIADSGASTLAAAADEDDTALSVAVSDGLPWVYEVDFDILVGGEVMTVTGISGASSPQTFTVARSVNGVVKEQASGSVVRLAQQAITGR